MTNSQFAAYVTGQVPEPEGDEGVDAPTPVINDLKDLIVDGIEYAYGVKNAIIGVEHEYDVVGLAALMEVHIHKLHEMEAALDAVSKEIDTYVCDAIDKIERIGDDRVKITFFKHAQPPTAEVEHRTRIVSVVLPLAAIPPKDLVELLRDRAAA